MFLASDVDLPTTEDPLTTILPMLPPMHVRKDAQPVPALQLPIYRYSIPIANALVKISEEHYAALQKVVDHFGQPDSKAWSDAFKVYEANVISSVDAEVKKAKAKSGEDAQIWAKMMVKLKFILTRQIMTGKNGLPPSDLGSLPLLCPSYILDLMDLLDNINGALTMVSEIV